MCASGGRGRGPVLFSPLFGVSFSAVQCHTLSPGKWCRNRPKGAILEQNVDRIVPGHVVEHSAPQHWLSQGAVRPLIVAMVASWLGHCAGTYDEHAVSGGMSPMSEDHSPTR